MPKLRLVQSDRSGDGQLYFQWMEGNKVIADIILYEEGLVEFSGNDQNIGIECVGSSEQQVTYGQVIIK